jgi:hypothetical protein
LIFILIKKAPPSQPSPSGEGDKRSLKNISFEHFNC